MNILFLSKNNQLLKKKLTFAAKLGGSILDYCNYEKEIIDHLYHHSYRLLILDGSILIDELKQVAQKIRAAFIATPMLIVYFENQAKEHFRSLMNGDETEFYFLKFPFLYKEFLGILQNIQVASLKQPRIPNLELEDLKLDLESRMVKRADKQYYLRNKEFCLLRFMMEHVGKALSRADIIDFVWDRNANIFTNTVDAHINNLRNKIDRGFEKKMIKTIHGFGYMLTHE